MISIVFLPAGVLKIGTGEKLSNILKVAQREGADLLLLDFRGISQFDAVVAFEMQRAIQNHSVQVYLVGCRPRIRHELLRLVYLEHVYTDRPVGGLP